jgi:hypothetical protein
MESHSDLTQYTPNEKFKKISQHRTKLASETIADAFKGRKLSKNFFEAIKWV